jgi:hypothetical protein
MRAMHETLPRLPPTVIQRARISAWLTRHAELPLRFLCGPAGAGKTTAIVTYLASRETMRAYVALEPDETLDVLRERLANALAIGYLPASFDALLAAIATFAPCEIAIDDIDRATSEALEELAELVAHAPAGISFVYGARSRNAINVRRFVARGLAATLDGSALAFSADDIVQLADAHGLAAPPAEVAKLLDETEGWPLVASWAIRESAERGSSLTDAYERWRRSHGRTFREFVDDELRTAGPEYRATFLTALRAPAKTDVRMHLATLEARGLFVNYANETYRLYRVARQCDVNVLASPTRVAAESLPLLVVRMFGRFEAEFNGRPIEWIRRREAQLFKYLLLKPNGTAPRAELIATFWPDADPQLATQSLRTASSNIRKAIAAIVGMHNVERYFFTRGDIGVDLERAVIDVRRFTAHVSDGDAERERGRLQEAFAHYRAAEALYSGELLSGDYPEPWYAARAAMYAALYAGVLERIAEIHAENGRERFATEYAQRARSLRPPEIAAAGTLQPGYVAR